MDLLLLLLSVLLFVAASQCTAFTPFSLKRRRTETTASRMMKRRPGSSTVKDAVKYSPLSVEPASSAYEVVESIITQQNQQNLIVKDFGNADDTCEVGINAVDNCRSVEGTESQLSATTNLAKCICGAGSFALPHVFLEEGVLGGTLAITVCGALAAYTMQSLERSKSIAASSTATPVLSYVELAETALGTKAAKLVFALTLSASIGV